MVDQWEFCIVYIDELIDCYSIAFYSPLGVVSNDIFDFIERHDPDFIKPKIKGLNKKPKELNEMISHFWALFLAEGWEPYSVHGKGLYFRKKYQG